MGSGSKKNARLFQLLCRWHDCDTPSFILSLSDYDIYGNHLRMHIDSSVNVANAVYARLKPEEEGSQLIFTCEWQGCNICLFTDPLQFTRHVMYHGYHSKLKDTGRQEQEKSKYGPCQLNIETRDYLPDLSEAFVCLWDSCKVEFQCPLDFFGHVDTHALRTEISVVDDPDEYFNCYVCRWEDCNCTFKTVYKLKEHCRVHTHEKLIACPVCGGFFSNRTKFIDHLSRQDSESYENFQCSHCLRRCASERLLRDHMRHHVNHLKCPQCDMTCPNPSSLRDHFRFRHCQDRPFACDICDFKCKSSSDLQRHEETHLGNRYSCPMEGCDFATKTLQYLKSHHKNKHEDSYSSLIVRMVNNPSISYDGSQFEEWTLQTDGGVKVKFKAAPQTNITRKFVCHICDARYTRGTGLTTHLKAKHNFRWPSGHPRFRYKEYEDGLFRLQMVRFESAELTEKLAEGEILDDDCIEEIIEMPEQNDFIDSSGSMQAQYILSTDDTITGTSLNDGELNLATLPKNLQETLSRARIILASTSGEQLFPTSNNTYIQTTSDTSPNTEDRTNLSLQLLQLATGQDQLTLQLSEDDSNTKTAQSPEIPLPGVSSARIEELSSTPEKDSSSHETSAINSTEAEESENPKEQSEGRRKRCKRRAGKPRKRKRISEILSTEDDSRSNDNRSGEDRTDYDQRLDISHTLLSLHSTGLIRL